MKKTITLLTILLFVVFMVGCENSINPTQPNNNQDISLAKQSNQDEAASTLAKGRQEKVEICHLTGNGKYVTISVAASAVQAHLDHGDIRTTLSGEWEVIHVDNDPQSVFLYNFDEWDGIHPNLGPVVTILTKDPVSCDDPTIYFKMSFPASSDTYTVEYYGYYTGEGKMAGYRDVFNNSGTVKLGANWTAERML